MQQGVDPTFNRSPGAAIAAPPESLPYVAAFDSAECDAIAVVATIAGLASPAQGAALAITSTSQIRFSSRFRTAAAPRSARCCRPQANTNQRPRSKWERHKTARRAP